MSRPIIAPALAALAAVFSITAAAADASYQPGSVLVRVRGSKLPAAAGNAGARGGGVAVRGSGVRLVPVSGDPRAAAARLARTKGVLWAEPNRIMHAAATANDPLLSQQHDLPLIGIPDAWNGFGFSGAAGWTAPATAAVAIVDTGVDAAHEDLAGRVVQCVHADGGEIEQGGCDDGNGHGSHVAGTIGAATGNGAGIAGIAPSAPLLICKALGDDGSGTTADIAACIGWAHGAGARIISMSLGGPSSKTLAAAVTAAWARGGRSGSLLVAAAGNDGDGSLEYPAALADVVSVAAVDDAGLPAPFSNANADVELSAPGVDVLSVRAGGGYVRLSGTSMAAPHVAGVASLTLAAHPGTAAALRKRLDAAVRDVLSPGRDAATGFGIVDATAAVR